MSTQAETASTQAPEEMFKIVRPAVGSAMSGQAARLGQLSLPGRPVLETPAFIAVTSRGTVPHVTHDNIIKHTAIRGGLMALEDFVERKAPPIYNTPASAPGSLRTFTATPDSVITVLAARRVPQVPAPLGNSEKHVKIFTSTGFADEKVADYPGHIVALQPDIAVPLADLAQSGGKNVPASAKRARRMAYRTETWLDTFFEKLDAEPTAAAKNIAIYAPVIATPLPMQWEYLQHLTEIAPRLGGLALYDSQILPELEADTYAALHSLPKMALDTPKTPHDVLALISLGVDVVTAPFVNATSDAGVCLTFSLPAASAAPAAGAAIEPSGTDMWEPSNRMDLGPLMAGCTCYACTRHHRAFVHHLLQAKEMLGWVLLQMHNFHVLSELLREVRAALAAGEFEQRRALFVQMYDAVLPQGTGARPRARGYHFKSEADQQKFNAPAWESLNPERSRSPSRERGDGTNKTGTETPAAEENVTKKQKTEQV